MRGCLRHGTGPDGTHFSTEKSQTATSQEPSGRLIIIAVLWGANVAPRGMDPARTAAPEPGRPVRCRGSSR